jgi:hypothetical protein
MPFTVTPRLVGTVLLAVAALLLAALTVHRHVAGDGPDLRQHSLPADTVKAIEDLTEELLALPAAEMPAALRQRLSPHARPEAAEGLAAMLQAMRKAEKWTVAAADGYGPSLIKAIYDLTDADGHGRQVALMFERSQDGGVVLLDVSL